MADRFLKLQLKPHAKAVESGKPEFDHAESGHRADPSSPDTLRFPNGLTVRVRKDAEGNLVMQVIDPRD